MNPHIPDMYGITPTSIDLFHHDTGLLCSSSFSTIVKVAAKDVIKKTAIKSGIDWDGHVARMKAVAEVRLVRSLDR